MKSKRRSRSPNGQLSTQDQQVAAWLLTGAENREIASELAINLRAVKHSMARLFRHYGITRGIKRVQLATLLYRKKKIK